MPRSSRSRLLIILLLLFTAGTAAAFITGNLPALPWDQFVRANSDLDDNAQQQPSATKQEPKNSKPAPEPQQAAVSPPPAKPALEEPVATPQQSPVSQKPPATATAQAKKDFDVATIDPNGVSVFAGSAAEPNARVTVLADGVEIGSTTAGADGEWTLVIEKKLSSKNPRLTVTTSKEQPAQTSATNSSPTQPSDAKEKLTANQPSPPSSATGQRKFAKADNLPSVRDIQAGFMRNLELLVETARASTQDRRTAAVVPASASQSASNETRPDENYARGPHPDPMPPRPVPLAKTADQIAVLIPVAFIFREPNLTAEGRRAAELLLEYVKLKRFKSLTLTGHADERGSPELNLELSRNRLQTVAEILKRGGYAGELNLVAKGKSEPFQGVDRSRFNREDLYQLDRRVELLASR